MPDTTAETLRTAAHLLRQHGLHTGDQFVGPDGRLDVCAAIYQAATSHLPTVFAEDEDAAIALVKASPQAIDAIHAVYDGLDSKMSERDSPEEYIDRVSYWAAMGEIAPPTSAEVIGRLLRTADTLSDCHRTAA